MECPQVDFFNMQVSLVASNSLQRTVQNLCLVLRRGGMRFAFFCIFRIFFAFSGQVP